MKHINVLEDVLILGGVTISLSMIQTILGIIILSVQVVLILIKAGTKIYNAIKKGKIDDVEDALNDAKDQLEDLKDKTDGKH